MDKTKRIQLLTNAEIADLYDRPDFNAEDWVEFYNANDDSVNISGWVFKDENDNDEFIL